MVQYKRKPVKLEPLPPFLSDDTEVWVIEATGEIFTDYERYLARRDFYQQRKFTCDATGHTGFTFFGALESEMDATKEIDSYFPEALRERVLNFVQFRNTPRMDDLVNVVFERFKEDYLVGDRVIVEEQGGRHAGIIRDIADRSTLAYYEDMSSMDTGRAKIYYIVLDGSATEIPKIGSKEFCRDRKVYSKLVLKQFLRNAVTRESWSGAPWMVKEKLAKQYNIPTKVPEAKTRDAVIAAKKAANAAHAANMANMANVPAPPVQRPAQSEPPRPGAFLNFMTSQQLRPSMFKGPGMPVGLEHPPRPQQSFQVPPYLNGRPPAYLPIGPNSIPQNISYQIPASTSGVNGLPINLPFQNQFMQYQVIAPTTLPPAPTPISQPPPIKYPIEDLDIQRSDASQRPPLKFFTDDVPTGTEPPENKSGVLMKSMGALLCIWETLNVHDGVYYLDSFTFDDFVDAMRFSNEEVECELFTEIHCSVLKQLIDENGKSQVHLPQIENDEDESDSDEDTSAVATPEPVEEEKPFVRTTRRSLAMAAELAAKKSPTPEEPKTIHRAAEFLSEYNWIEKCKARDFRNGGWQAMMVGLIYNISFHASQRDACYDILAQLVPPDVEPTLETIISQYAYLDVNLRVTALEMAVMLSVQTEHFRSQLAKASEDMTQIRKSKIEFQRERKELINQLTQLDNQRKILLPANMPASPTQDAKENADTIMSGTDEVKEDTQLSESEEEPRNSNRRLRHTQANKRKREEDAARKERVKKEKAEAAKTKQQREWQTLLDDIEKKKDAIRLCEEEIEEQENDLRETNVQRSKYLGKDRFMNRYYWFERNGMPYEGLPSSSTAGYGYANGRLWVQGPDKAEMEPLCTEPILSKDKEEFGVTIPERREREEGKTILSNSIQWGYYDNSKDIDDLLAWLDERGNRERVLRKELSTYRDSIIKYMEKMHEHLKENEKTKAEGEENATRVSTRTKTYVDLDTTKDRCLAWTNSVMREEVGHSHSEQVKPKRKKGEAKVKAPPKNAKSSTRQGTRYSR